MGTSGTSASCTPSMIQRYLSRISGPLLDRMDLHIQVPAVKHKELAQDETAEPSLAIRERIVRPRKCSCAVWRRSGCSATRK
jgi:magnesium chelatase family protein